MEILAASLTAITYFVSWFYFLKGRRELLCERAGPLLLEKRQWCKPRPWMLVWQIVFPICAIVQMGMVVYLAAKLNSPPLQIVWTSSQFLAAGFFVAIVFSPLLIFELRQSLEFREKGLLIYQGPMSYCISWGRVKSCEMSAVPGRLRMQLPRTRFDFDVSGGDAESVLAALATVVETRDRLGRVIHPEIQAKRREQTGTGAIPSWRFQIDLRTLLLFMLFASAALSWYGICYRRNAAEDTALARLDSFKPEIIRSPLSLWVVFSKSSVKPGDDDLVLLSDLDRLADLDLSGAPITDAGLAHLENLKSLYTLNLSSTTIGDDGLRHLEKLPRLRHLLLARTRVTNEGVKRLQQALPNLEVIR